MFVKGLAERFRGMNVLRNKLGLGVPQGPYVTCINSFANWRSPSIRRSP